MLGCSTIIRDSINKKLCMGWIVFDYSYGTRHLFGDEVISSDMKCGYPNSYTVSVKAMKEFCSSPDKHIRLRKNIFGSYDFTQPFDPLVILNVIKDMDNDEHIVIEEWDES